MGASEVETELRVTDPEGTRDLLRLGIGVVGWVRVQSLPAVTRADGGAGGRVRRSAAKDCEPQMAHHFNRGPSLCPAQIFHDDPSSVHLSSGRLDQDDAQGPRAVYAMDPDELDINGGAGAADPGEWAPGAH